MIAKKKRPGRTALAYIVAGIAGGIAGLVVAVIARSMGVI